MKSTVFLPLVLVAALSLTACGGSDSDSSDSKSAPSTSQASSAASSTDASASASPGIISPSLPAVPEFEVKPSGVINDITVDSCDTAAGPVKASGTAKNSGKFARDIVVVVNWAVTSTSDVLARGVTKIEDLAPGASADWSVTADLAGDEQVACVPTAYAGQLKK